VIGASDAHDRQTCGTAEFSRRPASPPPRFRHDASMRDQFRPPAADAAEFVKTAIVVPDTNVLLGLYRLSPTAREDAFKALKRVGDRLWLPHQVGLELYRNVDKARDDLANAYAALRGEVDRLRGAPTQGFGEGRRHQDSRTAIASAVTAAVDSLLGQIRELEGDDDAVVKADDDRVLAQIEELFSGKVGNAPDAAMLRDRTSEFLEHRVPNRIPPGFLDAGTKQEPLRAAGDFLLWSELLDHAEAHDVPHLLITDDTKEDWYVRAGGKTLGPLPELTLEFATRSRAGYHQMTLSHFVTLAEEHLGVGVDPGSVEEIEGTSEEVAAEKVRALGLLPGGRIFYGAAGEGATVNDALERSLANALALQRGREPADAAGVDADSELFAHMLEASRVSELRRLALKLSVQQAEEEAAQLRERLRALTNLTPSAHRRPRKTRRRPTTRAEPVSGPSRRDRLGATGEQERDRFFEVAGLVLEPRQSLHVDLPGLLLVTEGADLQQPRVEHGDHPGVVHRSDQASERAPADLRPGRSRCGRLDVDAVDPRDDTRRYEVRLDGQLVG
jgi:hypothetical protein